MSLHLRSGALVLALSCAAAAPAVAVVDAGPPPVEVPPEDAGVSDVDAGPAHPGFQLIARVEPDPVPFGGAVDLVVTLTRPARQRLTLPGDRGNDLEPSEALPRPEGRDAAVRREARELPDGRVQETLRWRFLALDVKDLKTPAFVIKVGPGEAADDADAVVLEVPALPVRVDVRPVDDHVDGGVPPGTLVVDAAADQLTFRVRDDRPWIALALLLLTAVVVVIARWWLRRARAVQRAKGPPPIPPRPAHEIALERLDALLPLLQRGEVTIFVEKMMDEVLRDYLAGRFALAAGTRTTREIVTDLLAVTTTNLDVNLVEEVGKDADLVKFARAHLAAAQAHAMAGRVRALILATAEKPASSSSSSSSSASSSASSGGPKP